MSLNLGCVSEPVPGHERFVGMMSIPYCTPNGVLALKFRRMDDGPGPRYDSPSGQHARLYNVGVLADPRNDVIAICEGELDAAVCTYEVGVPAVGTPGGTWLEHWTRCFADVDNLLIIADNDDKEDGSNPGMKRAEKIKKLIPRARIVVPPLGHDLGSWALEYGVDAVREGMGV